MSNKTKDTIWNVSLNATLNVTDNAIDAVTYGISMVSTYYAMGSDIDKSDVVNITHITIYDALKEELKHVK